MVRAIFAPREGRDEQQGRTDNIYSVKREGVDLFAQDDFRTQYALAKEQGDKRFGSECKHIQTKDGYCCQCLRKVVEVVG